MMHNLKISFTIIISSILILGCGEANAKRKPKWVTNRPVDNNYYIGIGKASKQQSDIDYMQIAKSTALADIISEISVNISSNSILSQFEDNSGYKETYAAQIKLSTKDYVEGYELIDSWENKEEYWVYYRLSKTEYQHRKREVLDRAKNMSKDFYEKAKESEKTYDINNALTYYVKAFNAIKKYIGEDLSVFTFDGKIYLDNAIYQSIQDIFSRIRIVPEKDIYNLKVLSSNNEPVYVKVKLRTDIETQNVSNLPITFSFADLNLKDTENVVSLNNGKAECTIANMASKGRTQIIKAELNTDIYLGKDSPDNLLKILLNESGVKPYGNINIVVKEIFAYLESQEMFMGNYNFNHPITRLFEQELSENFFSFTKEKEGADVIIRIKSEVVEGVKLDKHNLHTSFLNCNIRIIKTDSELEIYNESLQNIKGMKSGSFKLAGQDAIAKAEKEIKNKIIPNIRKINL
jgi:LPP20 lipoprotein